MVATGATFAILNLFDYYSHHQSMMFVQLRCKKLLERNVITKIIFILTYSIFIAVAFSQSSDKINANKVKSNDSDPQAIRIADEVMNALGGKENWDNTHYISWNFFGKRFHVWDKWNGNLRLQEKDLIVLINLNTQTGRTWQNADEVTDADSLSKILQHAYAAWINDSYWMFMPYKLKDPGVILHYKGEGVTTDGKSADILQLTFEDVGLTPNNKYHVYVEKKSNLVIQFDYFQNANDDKPTIQAPWKDWKKYGNIMLSDDRGDRKMTDIAVFDKLPEVVFSDPEPVDIYKLIKK